MLATMGNGISVEVLRNLVTGRDSYGNDTSTSSSVTYSGCALLVSSSSEDDDGRTTVSRICSVVIPDGAVVTATDKVRLPNGTVWDVDGEPHQQRSQITGSTGGLWVRLRRVTG